MDDVVENDAAQYSRGNVGAETTVVCLCVSDDDRFLNYIEP